MSVKAKHGTTYSDNATLINTRSKFKHFRHVNRITCFLASFKKRSKSADPRNKFPDELDVRSPSCVETVVNGTKGMCPDYCTVDFKSATNGNISQSSAASHDLSTTLSSVKRDNLSTTARSSLRSDSPWSLLRRHRAGQPGRKDVPRGEGWNSSMTNSMYDRLPSTLFDTPCSPTGKPAQNSSVPKTRTRYSSCTNSNIRTRPFNRKQTRPASEFLGNTPNALYPHSTNKGSLPISESRQRNSLSIKTIHPSNSTGASSDINCNQSQSFIPSDFRPPKVQNFCKLTTCYRFPKPSLSTSDCLCGSIRSPNLYPVIYPPRQDPIHSWIRYTAFRPYAQQDMVSCRSETSATDITNATLGKRDWCSLATTSKPCPTVGPIVVSTLTHSTKRSGADSVAEATTSQTRSLVSTARPRSARPHSTLEIQEPRILSGESKRLQLPNSIRNSWTSAVPKSSETQSCSISDVQSTDTEVDCPLQPKPLNGYPILLSHEGREGDPAPTSSEQKLLAATVCDESPSSALKERSRLPGPPLLRPPRPPLRTTSLARDGLGKSSCSSFMESRSNASPTKVATTEDTLTDSEVERTVLQQDPTWWIHLLPYKPSNLPTNLADRLKQRNSLMLSRSSPTKRLSNGSLPTGLPILVVCNSSQPAELMTQSLYEQRDSSHEDCSGSLQRRSRNVSVPRHTRNRLPNARPSSLYTERITDDTVLLPSLAHLTSSFGAHRNEISNRCRNSRPSALPISSLTPQCEQSTPTSNSLPQMSNSDQQSSVCDTTNVSQMVFPRPTMDSAVDSPLLSQYCRLLIMRTTRADAIPVVSDPSITSPTTSSATSEIS